MKQPKIVITFRGHESLPEKLNEIVEHDIEHHPLSATRSKSELIEKFVIKGIQNYWRRNK